eukprot:s125_g9.t1
MATAAMRRFASCAGKATRFARVQSALPAARLPLACPRSPFQVSVRSYITVQKYTRDDVVSLLDEYHATVMSTNWADYLNLVYSVPFWEAEFEHHGSKWMDVFYQCEDVRDHLNELAELATRASGFMGTGFAAEEKVENMDEHAWSSVATLAFTGNEQTPALCGILEKHPDFKPKIEQTIGHGLAILRQKHKFKFQSMHRTERSKGASSAPAKRRQTESAAPKGRSKAPRKEVKAMSRGAESAASNSPSEADEQMEWHMGRDCEQFRSSREEVLREIQEDNSIPKLFQLSRERHQQLRSTASSPAAPAASPSTTMQVSEKSVKWLLFASCLSLLGFTMPGPALPGIRSKYELLPWETGFIASSLSVGMLFAVSFWPHRSDSMGRRKVLMGSLFATSLLFLLQVCALNSNLGFWTFALARIATGLFAGCNPIFKAYLADVVPSDRLPFFMVYREASATMAFIVGPTLGGILTTDRGTKVLDRVFAMSFFYVVSQTCFTFFMPLYLNDTFGLTPRGIGWFLTATSMAVFAFQVAVYKPFEKWLGLEYAGCSGALTIFLGLSCIALTDAQPDKALLCIGALFYAFGSATFPTTVPTVLAKSVPKHRRGRVLGADSFMNNVGREAETPQGMARGLARHRGGDLGAFSFFMKRAQMEGAEASPGGFPFGLGSSSSSSSQFSPLLRDLKSEDGQKQLVALTELAEQLSFSSEEALISFPMETFIPLLVNLLGNPGCGDETTGQEWCAAQGIESVGDLAFFFTSYDEARAEAGEAVLDEQRPYLPSEDATVVFEQVSTKRLVSEQAGSGSDAPTRNSRHGCTWDGRGNILVPGNCRMSQGAVQMIMDHSLDCPSCEE